MIPTLVMGTKILARRTIAKPAVAARTRRVTKIAARRIAVAFPGVGLLAVRSRALRLAGIRPPLAIAVAALALAKPALGEFLLRPARSAGTALAPGRTVTPAAGIIVFVVVPGHEG